LSPHPPAITVKAAAGSSVRIHRRKDCMNKTSFCVSLDVLIQLAKPRAASSSA